MKRFFCCTLVAFGLLATLAQPVLADPDDDDDSPSAPSPARLDARSLHMFRETMHGGIEAILVRQGSHAELAHVRAIVHEQYERARAGAYPDQRLRKLAPRIQATFSELPTGAQVVFSSQDMDAVSALHAWFAAEVRADRAKHPGGGPGVGQ